MAPGWKQGRCPALTTGPWPRSARLPWSGATRSGPRRPRARGQAGAGGLGIERREVQTAQLEGRAYVAVTEPGAAVQAVRQERALLVELRARAQLAREVYASARDDGAYRVTAGLAALRTAAQKHGVREQEHGRGDAGLKHGRNAGVQVQGLSAGVEKIR